MINSREYFKNKLNELSNAVNRELDYDFTTVSQNIKSMEDFHRFIFDDFVSGKKLFYRGERINDPNRRLLPTLYRDSKFFLEKNETPILHIDSEYLYNYYFSLGSFVEVFNQTMGKVDKSNLYELCAFSQHYYHSSPLIDFTKSLYPSLSFALKDREEYNDDIVLYVLKIVNLDDYTCDINIANKWLEDIDIYMSYLDESTLKLTASQIIEERKFINTDNIIEDFLDRVNTKPIPKAKLIDIPTNTRMKFQQGVFMLLTDFQMFNNNYLTKDIRENFEIKKYVISKEICPYLLDLIKQNAPWYTYDNLTNIENAFKIATKNTID